WTHPPFELPAGAYHEWDARDAGNKAEAAWNEKLEAYAQAFPDLAAEFTRRMKGELPRNFHQTAIDTGVTAHTKGETVASRKASQLALEAYTAALPEMLGGSADLTGSTLTNTKCTPSLRFDDHGAVVRSQGNEQCPDEMHGRHINYGVREFGMAAI